MSDPLVDSVAQKNLQLFVVPHFRFHAPQIPYHGTRIVKLKILIEGADVVVAGGALAVFEIAFDAATVRARIDNPHVRSGKVCCL